MELRKPWSQIQKELCYQRIILFEDQELGTGAYGKVCKALCDELPCAAKLLHPALVEHFSPGNLAIFNKFLEECELKIRHPCIVQYLNTYIHPQTAMPVLLMELLDENLTKFVERSERAIPFHIQINLCHDVALALAFLHSNNVIHRDLTGNNVLIYAGTHAKITDFGMMRLIEDGPRQKSMTMCPGCPAYMPPEAFRHLPVYSGKLDVFSFGVVTLQILTRRFPQPSYNRDMQIQNRRSHLSLVSADHPLLPMVRNCLKDAEKSRPTSVHLCRMLAELKATPEYETSRQAELGAPVEVERLREELEGVLSELNSLKESSRCLRNGSPPKASLVDRGRMSATPLSFNSIEDSPDYDIPEESSPDMWYHGKISRDTACSRLSIVGHPGAFLVRQSESTPGSYVLSFLDRQEKVFNYKIEYFNGQFSTSCPSNRTFSSLQELINYYSKYSTVKQNQHLNIPVPPPKAVPFPDSY